MVVVGGGGVETSGKKDIVGSAVAGAAAALVVVVVGSRVGVLTSSSVRLYMLLLGLGTMLKTEEGSSFSSSTAAAL